MNNLKRLLSIAVLAGLAAAPGAWAAVNNSHHDLSATGWNTQTEVCLYCHGVTSVTDATDFGAVGALCMTRCHDGHVGNFAVNTNPVPNRPATMLDTGGAVAVAASQDAVRVIDGFAHGINKNDLRPKTGGATPVSLDSSPAYTAAYPYVAAANGTGMQCTSCHNVHDKANPPFLHRSLFTGAGGNSFCQDCHYPAGGTTPDGRGNNWAAGEAAPNGDHPVNFNLILGNVANPANRTNVERRGRYIQIDGAGTTRIFDVTTNTVLTTQAQAYVTGGKVSSWTTAAGGERFGCYTCHSAHMDPGTALNPNLLLRRTVNTDAGVAAVGTWNPLCVSCHGDLDETLDSTEQNPGLNTSGFYHPVGPNANAGTMSGSGATLVGNYRNSNGTFRFTVSLGRIAMVGNQGGMNDNTCGIEATTGKPRCTSCHDVHGGISNSQALIDLDGTRDGAFTGTFCNACHGGGDLADLADNAGSAGEQKAVETPALAGVHHRTRAAGITVADGSNVAVTDADTDSLTINGASWSAGAGTAGDMADGLGCVDCHVFDRSVHSTAHNW